MSILFPCPVLIRWPIYSSFLVKRLNYRNCVGKPIFTIPTAQLQFKPGVVSHDDQLRLAHDVGNKWEQLCRILLNEKHREHIERDKTSLFDKCFATLCTWVGAQGSGATYCALGMALKTLMEEESDTEDLCTRYCLESQGVMESEDTVDSKTE